MKAVQRRDFIKLSAAGMVASQVAIADPPKKFSAYERVELGKSGLKPTRLVFGTGVRSWNRSSELLRKGRDYAVKVMRTAYERGIRCFDMADTYGSHQPVAEALEPFPRDSYVAITKIWWRSGGPPDTQNVSVEQLIERFLRELKTDYIDLVQLHCVDDIDWPAKLADRMEALGLAPQVIPGQVEGSLTFLGVAADAPDEPLLVADSGGGSTELALGSFAKGAILLDDVRSLDVGCRRVTELFLQREDPPSAQAIAEARAWCAGVFVPHLSEVLALAGNARPRLFAVGGTVTSLVAVHEGIVPYDSTRVHLHELSRKTVDAEAAHLLGVSLAERAQVAGLQAKRAPVIGAGAVVIGELMRAGGFDALTVSEHDLLYGLAQAAFAAHWGGEGPVAGWKPVLSRPA